MKTLNDYFTKIYCINLDRRPDRWEECVSEFKKINANVDRVPAIDGKDMTTPSPNLRPGAYALRLAHIRLIKDAILNKIESFVVFEDDVTFVEDFNDKFNAKIDFLPKDWDMLYLGGNNIFYPGAQFSLVTGDKSLNVGKHNYKELNYELCKTPWTQCAHAIAFNSRFYEPLLVGIDKYWNEPIDTVHFLLQRDGYNAYVFLPSLAIQRPSFSDIENQFTNYASHNQNNF